MAPNPGVCEYPKVLGKTKSSKKKSISILLWVHKWKIVCPTDNLVFPKTSSRLGSKHFNQWTEVRRAGTTQPAEEEAQGCPINVHKYLKRRQKMMEPRSFENCWVPEQAMGTICKLELSLEIFKSQGNLLWVSLLMQGVGPDSLPSSLPISLSLRLCNYW